MIRILPALAAALTCALPAAAQTEVAAADAVAEPAAPASEQVKIATAMGTIVLEIETERAPVTAANFLEYVEKGLLENAAFYRSARYGDDGHGFIQFGLRRHPDFVLPPIAHEPTSDTGLTHLEGTISMVRGEPGTADADYMIMFGGDQPQWDAREDGEPGYAAFGRVVQGMETVSAIADAAIDPDEGEGVLKGQILAKEVDVVSAERLDD